MKKNKYLILFIFLFLFLSFNSAMALEISDYPSVPGVQAPTDCSSAGDKNCLPRLATYFIGLGIYIAGGIAVISFAVGAVQYIASADSAQMQGDAKDRMKGAVLGLILAVSSIIIAQTISQDLVKVALNPISGVAGVFYVNGESKITAPKEEANTINAPEGYGEIQYCCSNDCSGGIGPNLIIWEYPETNFVGTDNSFNGVTVVRKQCGETETLSDMRSFKTEYERPGVYYFLEAGCTGLMSRVNTLSQDKIEEPFRRNIKSIRIVNDSNAENPFYYAAIFHKEEQLKNGGECSEPLVSIGEAETCQDVDIQASAVDIFVINGVPGTSGNGVSFYSEKQGWDTGSQAGFYDIDPESITMDGAQQTIDPKQMCFEFDYIDVPDWYMYKCTDSACGGNGMDSGAEDCDILDPEACSNSPGTWCINGKCATGLGCTPGGNDCPEGEKCDSGGQCSAIGSAEGVDCSEGACETFKDCHGSIKIRGSYLVAIYAKQTNATGQPDNSKPLVCQTFTKDAENLGTEQVIAPGVKEIDKIYIIPTAD